jgi:hypothetical protein
MSISKFSDIRLLDVCLLGPIQILISKYVIHPKLKLFIFLVGILNIIYNGHNYLYLDMGVLNNPLPGISLFVHKKHGKYNFHRLFNLCIMYPIFLYIYKVTVMPKWLSRFFLLQIIIGFIFNLTNFIKIANII